MGSSIGQPVTRREGVLKVTGTARYAADNHPPGMLFAVMAVSSIARGRVTGLDVAAAKVHPGVVEVMTSANVPQLAMDPDEKDTPFTFRLDLLQNDTVRYANQPIAVVVAQTLEAATEGAALLAPQYQADPARTGLDSVDSFAPPPSSARATPGRRIVATWKPGCWPPRSRSRRCTRRRRNTTTPWNRTRSWRPGTATRSPSTRRAK